MKHIKKIGTIVLISISVIGFLTIVSTMGAFFLSAKGMKNSVSEWLLQNASVNLDWKSQDPLAVKYEKKQSKLEKYKELVVAAEGTIENFCTTSFPENKKIKAITDFYREDIMQNRLNTVLGGKSNSEYVEEAMNYIQDFKEYLDKDGIGFVYVQLPSSERIQASTAVEAANTEKFELADLFEEKMNQSSVNFVSIDSIKEIKEFQIDATNHWDTASALCATRYLAEYLNSNQILGISADTYDEEFYIDLLDSSPEVKKNIEAEFGYNYRFLVPQKEYEYGMCLNEDISYEGDFIYAIVSEKDEWDARIGNNSPIAYHNLWKINNGALVNISNNSEDALKCRVLVLGDSFSWPMSAYLSESVSEIACIHPRYFVGNVRSYIEQYKPNLVIMMYQENQVGLDNKGNFGSLE